MEVWVANIMHWQFGIPIAANCSVVHALHNEHIVRLGTKGLLPGSIGCSYFEADNSFRREYLDRLGDLTIQIDTQTVQQK